MNNPNFIIIGAQKASTSSMLHILNQHPDIYLPKNEIDIFEIDNFYDYENFFNKLFLKSGGKINGIKRPNYIGLLDIPEKIEINLEGLVVGDSIKISTVELPDGVKPTITDRDFTIATIAAPTKMADVSTESSEETDEEEAEAVDTNEEEKDSNTEN